MNFTLTAGLLASVLHVITGPDHLAAVMPFAIESKRKAWKIGLFWGIGHIVGMLLIGVLFMVFRELIPVDQISNYSEQMVGFVLIGIGIWAFFKVFIKNEKHKHVHIHSDNSPFIHEHEHQHSNDGLHHHSHKKEERQSNFASFSIGVLHGFAGIAHFLLFIPIMTFDTKLDSILYIVGFASGIILSMAIFAFVVGQLSSFARDEHNDILFKGIRLAGGIFAVIIGIYWVWNN